MFEYPKVVIFYCEILPTGTGFIFTGSLSLCPHWEESLHSVPLAKQSEYKMYVLLIGCRQPIKNSFLSGSLDFAAKGYHVERGRQPLTLAEYRLAPKKLVDSIFRLEFPYVGRFPIVQFTNRIQI